ncbi:MAG: glucosylceramidase [Acholeplasmataceae bacterium]|nr:MAG: glucosylceramidase [Acholeplasmataceae bacterium]
MTHIRTRKDSTERLTKVDLTLSETTLLEVKIEVDVKKRLQTILGFGGAFTEASTYNLSRINPVARGKAMKAYFDPVEGLGYTLGRVSIHGCDFSLGSYLYIKDYDDTLESFDISRDQPIIDTILVAAKLAGQPIKILASPWTPPFWMKTNHSPIQGGKLIPSYYQTWADYFVRFISAYEKAGVDIFGVTVQNEPLAVQRWDSCIYDHEEERDFVKVLGQTFEAHGLQDKKILIWDHNRDVMVERAKAIYDDPVARRYVWGTAFHWYDNEQFNEVRKHAELFPDKHLLFTEGCQERGPHFDEYAVGERYGRNMINDLRNQTEGYIDWNLFLDDTGGPNHVNNLCSAPVMFKIFQEEVVLMPAYYYIGHISRYVRPGAVQLASSGHDGLWYVVFENNDQSKVVIIQNEQDEDVNVFISGLGDEIRFTCLKHSISTLLI